MQVGELAALAAENRAVRALVDAGARPGACSAIVSARLRPLVIAGIVRAGLDVRLVLAPSAQRAAELVRDLATLLPDVSVLDLPAWDVLPFEPLSPSVETVARRLRAFEALAGKTPERGGRPALVVAPVGSCLQITRRRDELPSAPLDLAAGNIHELGDLVRRLDALGYRRADLVEAPGDFSVRGGIVDVWPASEESPVRAELLGDEVESLRYFDASSQRSIAECPPVRVYGCREYDSATVGAAAGDWLRTEQAASLGAGEKAELELIAEGQIRPGGERFLPVLLPESASPVDFLSPGGVIVVDEPREVADNAERTYSEQTGLAAATLSPGFLKAEPDLAARYFLDAGALAERLGGRLAAGSPVVELGTIVSGEGDQPRRIDSLAPDDMLGRPDRLARFVGEHPAPDWTALALVGDEGERRRLDEILRGLETEGGAPSGAFPAVVGSLTQGFIWPDAKIAVITEAEVFGRRVTHRETRAREKHAMPAVQLDLKPGDYVVHVSHGIGRFEGLVRECVESGVWDCLVVTYSDGVLKVRSDQVGKLSKYVGADTATPRLSALGSARWKRTRESASKSAAHMARELLELYAVRQDSAGFAFMPDAPWQAELEESFPFRETSDQLTAISDVKRDMETARPMDRLVCGDVGYGKTEVAVRAAFKAVLDGKQVLVLAPTTILAQQHHATFSQRFAPFPVLVEMLSRFRTHAEQRAVMEQLAEGKVDVVVGTHRLLQPDVRPRDPGLIIVDEEHRFGVSAKERLKAWRKSVDVLTLSATPIPRTLQMSLSGIRDLSLIETAPEDRFPVLTHVGDFASELAAMAIRREMARGGQVYYVHNRVQSIAQAAERVRRLVPGARIAVAHGQMHERDLERIMAGFSEGDADVLVCTTIIESGIDIPSVNTIIVEGADRLGLAQLYQLRGRVGRSDERAYAYFFLSPGLLTGNAAERLRTIAEFSELGSGLKVALRDLEIRGAGNLLGAEQHGHLAAVGFELYCDLLRRAVARLKGTSLPEAPDVKLSLPVTALLPPAYIESGAVRVQQYRNLMAAATRDELDDAVAGLVDRFGPPPPEVERLVDVCRLRLAAAELGVGHVQWEAGRLLMWPAGPGLADRLGRAAETAATASGGAVPAADVTHSYRAKDKVFVARGVPGEQALSFVLGIFDGIIGRSNGPVGTDRASQTTH